MKQTATGNLKKVSKSLLLFSLLLISVIYLRSTNTKPNYSIFLAPLKQYYESKPENTLNNNAANNSIGNNQGYAQRNLAVAYDQIVIDACGTTPADSAFVTDSEKKSGAADINEMKSNYRDSDMTVKLLKDGQLQKFDMNDPATNEWAMDTLRFAIPWAVFLVLLILCFPFYLCYCCDCCPCCEGCRQQGYYKGMELRWPAAIALIAAGLLIGAAIYGVTTQADLGKSIKRFRCAAIFSLDTFNAGDGATWTGLNGFLERLQGIRAQLTGFFKTIDSTFAPRAWITDDPQTFQTDTQQIGDTNVIYTKDPVDASPINTNSLFIANQFSGNDWQNNISTYMGKIFRILTPSLDSVSNALLQVNDQGLSLKTDSKGFTSNVDTGITAVQDAIKSINDLQKQLNDNLKDNNKLVEDQITNYFGYVYYIIIGVSALTGIALLYMMVTGRRACRICLHCAWLLTLLFGLIFLILATIGVPTSLVTMEVCEGVRLALNLPGELKTYQDVDAEMAKRITTCQFQLGGDGQIINTFDIKNQLNTILSLRQKLETAFATTDSSNTESPLSLLKSNKGLITEAYNAALSVLQSGKDTTGQSEVASKDELDKVVTGLDKLNSFTLKASRNLQNGCTSLGTNDKWVQDTADCPAGYAQVSTKAVDSQQDSCVPVDIFAVGPNPAVSDRYPDQTKSFPGCLNFATIQSTYENLFYSLNERYTQFIAITNQLSTNPNSIDQTYNNYLAKVQEYQLSLTDFQTTAIQILDQFDEQNDKYVLNDLQCLFIGGSLDDLHGSLCYLMLPAFYTISKLGIVIGIASFIATFFLFFTAIRFYKNDQLEKEHQEQGVDDRGRPVTNTGQQYQIPGVD